MNQHTTNQDISPEIDIRRGCIYIELNGWTYYIDDSTGEQIFEKWKNERNEK